MLFLVYSITLYYLTWNYHVKYFTEILNQPIESIKELNTAIIHFILVEKLTTNLQIEENYIKLMGFVELNDTSILETCPSLKQICSLDFTPQKCYNGNESTEYQQQLEEG